MEKLLVSMDFKCTEDFKALVTSLANDLNMDRSQFLRLAVEAEVQRHRAMYEALHSTFSNERTTVTVGDSSVDKAL